jgi:phospholipase D1/2
MPAVPAFAGDLQGEGALGTRAIMEFQYNSICRGGHSILETLVQSGVPDPSRYINFYNLRTYDRIAAVLPTVEAASGVSYEDARRDFDESYSAADPSGGDEYHRYQSAASHLPAPTWDSVSACATLSGPPLPSAPWTGPPEAEIDAFVSEQLYIHSKVLIADDQIVLVGSANLNDRSQLGNHDSEIAVVIEDPTPVRTTMAGRPYTASAFATSLRRQLYGTFCR